MSFFNIITYFIKKIKRKRILYAGPIGLTGSPLFLFSFPLDRRDPIGNAGGSL